MTPERKNLSASVHDRLLNRSRERGEDFSFVLHRYAAERLLYRLGLSTHRERLVLKGAMLFAVWGGSAYRPTRDLDFTGYGNNDADAVLGCFREICDLIVPDDAIVFDSSTLTSEQIRDDAEYDGLRVRLSATLGTARIPLQIDIGFGNAIEPSPTNVEYPTLLNSPAPRIRAYPHEAVVAEKFHCMVRFGERNSRLKDFYDLYVLAREFPFVGEQLTAAIAATFERRSTPIDAAQPAALTPRFYADTARATQWRTYLERNGLSGAPTDFDSVGELIRGFLGPVWNGLAENVAFTSSWRPGGAWNSEDTEDKILMATSAPASATRQGQQHSGNADAAHIEGVEIPLAIPLRRFKPYPAYKDSGVEWLGEIPEDWQAKKIKRLCLVRRGASPRPIEDPIYFDDEGEYAWVRIADVTGSGRYLESTTQRLSDLGKSKSVALEPGELFLSIAATVGKPIITKINCCIHDGFVYFVGLRENRDYLYYVFSCGEPYKGLGKLGTQLNLNTDTIGDIFLPIPSIDEQQTIATFLDRETAKIDALVAKKERLIELLQEKRAALITRVVTKGLNPSVPMKDSGVEWLGEIPAHWEVAPLKRYVRPVGDAIKTGPFGSQLLASEMQGGDVKVYNQRTVIDRDFNAGENFISNEKYSELASFAVEPGDLLVTTRGTIGRCAIVPERAEKGILHPCLMRIQLDHSELLSEFVLSLIQDSDLVQTQLALASNATTIDVIYSATMSRVIVPKPPLGEQRAIVVFLDGETATVDALMAKIHDGLDRLLEFRMALISAAVMGKIDVREEAA